MVLRSNADGVLAVLSLSSSDYFGGVMVGNATAK